MLSARCSKILKRSCYSSLLFSLSLTFPASAFAGFVQEQYYDWGVSDRRVPTVLGLSVRAQETTGTEATATPTITTDLTSPGILSNNPLHFFDTAIEAVQETFTFNPEAKAQLKLDHAEERLSEANTLVESGNIDAATKTFEDYQAKLSDATDDLVALKSQGADIAALADSVEQATAKNTTVLEEVALKVPEQATGAVEDALSVSQTGMDRAADAKGEPPIPVDLLARMNALRGQGILTEEEAGSLVNATSREGAREIFKNLVDQGVAPEADFKRFDTAQAKYLPQDFVKGVEVSKFNELKRLEASGGPSGEIKQQLEQFAGTYKPGDIVPPEIRKHWAQTVRLEEVQKTFRPDLLSTDLFAGRQGDFSKLQELQSRARPTSQEAALAEQYAKNNPGQPLPPGIQRVLDLKDKLGVLSEGATPPAGHKESSFLPSSVFKYFGEIPFQLGAPSGPGAYPTTGGTGTGSTGTYSSGTTGTTGGYHPPTAEDYSKYFQGQNNFLPQPTYTTSGGTSSGTSGTSGTGDFRYPYYPPPTTSGTSGTSGDSTYHPPSGTTGTYTPPSSYTGTSGTTATHTYTPPSSYSSGSTTPPPSGSTTPPSYTPPSSYSTSPPPPSGSTPPPPAPSGSTPPPPPSSYSPPPPSGSTPPPPPPTETYPYPH